MLKLYVDDCSTHKCPTGSQCKVCNETGLPYCVYSCDIDNGGCDDERLCIEVDAPSCIAGDCCSPVNVTCDGTYVITSHIITMHVCTCHIHIAVYVIKYG